MRSGDKYAHARALSVLFEELVSRIGNQEQARDEMTSRLGPAWMDVITTDDVGPEFIPENIKLTPSNSNDGDKYLMFQNARQMADELDIPKDNLEYERYESASDDTKPCISDLLRQLADLLENPKEP